MPWRKRMRRAPAKGRQERQHHSPRPQLN
jgi:hypothetical protein